MTEPCFKVGDRVRLTAARQQLAVRTCAARGRPLSLESCVRNSGDFQVIARIKSVQGFPDEDPLYILDPMPAGASVLLERDLEPADAERPR